MDRVHVSCNTRPAHSRWDKKLFPDHVGFLKDLHDRDLKVSLNVHPADGVRSFEAAYGDMCKAMNRDTDKQVVSRFTSTSLNQAHCVRIYKQGVPRELL